MKRFLICILTLALAISLCACGKDYKSSNDSYVPMSSNAFMADYAAGSGLSSGNYSASEEYAVAESYKESSSDSNGNQDAPDIDPEKIIYSADATVETLEFDKTIEGLNAMIAEYGAYTESSSISNGNYASVQAGKYSRSASYTIRVPASNFDALMNNLSSLGNVPSSHVYSENVSSQYYDTAARLKTYQAQEQRLIELLDMAETVSDVIEIENELTEVRYRIESLQTTLKSWDSRVAYSTVSLSVKEVFEYTPEQTPGYGKRLWSALKDGIENLGYFFLQFVEALPVLILIGAIIYGVIVLIKALVRKGREKREKKKAKKEIKPSETESQEKK